MRASATISAALDPGQTRQIALVKNSPTEYGTNGFEINWVDASIPQHYLADSTNDAIDPVDTATYFRWVHRKRQDTGSKSDPGQLKDQRQCAGPNGGYRQSGHTWAGGGAGNTGRGPA